MVVAALLAGAAVGGAITAIVFALAGSDPAPLPRAVAVGPPRVALETQLAAIGNGEYRRACMLYDPGFFVTVGRNPALCQQTLSKDFAGRELAYRVDFAAAYAVGKAIVIVEIAQGDAAGECRKIWASGSASCDRAAPFAALLVRRGDGWRVAALNGL